MQGDTVQADIGGIIAAAHEAGVDLWVEGKRLRFRSHRGEIPPFVREQLRARREDLIAHLRADAARQVTTGALGYNQRGLWFLHRLAPESAAYHVAFAARIHGVIDAAALQEALQVLVDRHEALRTTYPERGSEPIRQVVGYLPVALLHRDARGLAAAQLHAAVAADYARPFDLGQGPLLRATLYRGDADAVLLLVAHHLAVDGTSLFVLLNELFTAYTALVEGKALPLRSAPTQYADFVAWQQQSVSQSAGDAAFWAERLDPPPPPLDLPADRPRPRIPRMRGNSLQHSLTADLSDRVAGFARTEGATEFVALLAMWYAFLYRMSGQDDLTVGTPVHGRSSVRFERTIGDLINMVPLRARGIGQLSFRELLRQARRVVMDSLAHQDYPLPLMVERLGRHEDRLGAPFQTLFVLQDFAQFGELERLFLAPEGEHLTFGALTLSRFPLTQQEGQFDVSLEATRNQGRLACVWKYDSDLFDEPTIRRWTGAYATLLQAALAHPDAPLSELEVLSAADRAELESWNATARDCPPLALHELIAAQAAHTPAVVAVTAGDGTWTYAQLLDRACRISGGLRELGVGPGDRVGVLLRRGRDLPAALLGVLGAGATYVPLDPKFPAARLRYMLEDSEARALVTDGTALDGLALPTLAPEAWQAAQPTPFVSADPESAAYVIYTSGSTGQPKGVAVPHRAVVNFLTSMAQEPGLTSADVLLSVTTISFDIAGLELYLPLTVGARVYVADEEEVLDGVRLARRMAEEGVTVLQATPATWKLLLATGWAGKRDLRALCGGEALPESLAQELLPRVAELWNLYGPTETTIWSTVDRVQPGEPVLVGRPIANTTVYVLDPTMQPVPIGVAGELWIGGAGVALGYVNRPELTAERFVASPFRPDERLYRTGDLVRLRADGRLQHLGRLDHQVKVRGFRIELGEIETRLQAHAAVRDAVVVARDERLVAYVVPADGAFDPAALRGWLAETLPDYMLPGLFMELEALPLTPNGKVDRKALPHALPDASSRPAVRTPPVTTVELALASIWAGLLGVQPVREDDFFSLGGHSLLAARLANLVHESLGVALPLTAVFQAPTLHELAARIEEMSPVVVAETGLEVLEF